MHASFSAALHHLVVALHVRGNEDDLGSPAFPGILEELHCIRAPSSLL